MTPHPLPDIDPREFVYAPPLVDMDDGIALWGTAREQWKWWYREQRMQRAGRPISIGEIGHMEGMRIFTGMDRPAEIITVGLGYTNAASFLRPMSDNAALSLVSFDEYRGEEFVVRNLHLPEVPVPKLTPRHRERPAHERIAAQKGRQHRLVRRK